MKGWRTLAFNAALALAGVVVAFDWGSVLPAQYVGIAAVVVAAINAGLRIITTTPIGEKK